MIYSRYPGFREKRRKYSLNIVRAKNGKWLVILGRRRGRAWGYDVRVEEVVPGVGEAREAPVDAVGVGLGVGLLLRGEQLPLPQRVHRGVRVLADLRQRSYVDEVHRYLLHRPCHALSSREEIPIRAHLQFFRVVDCWLCLGEAFYGIGAAPTFTPRSRQ